MTTFTSEDRENAKLVEEAPYHPGYEDASMCPAHIVDRGASVMTLRDAIDQDSRIEMYREQLHAQQCEINALRKALMYNKPKDLTDEEIKQVMSEFYSYNPRLLEFARAILRKAQEK